MSPGIFIAVKEAVMISPLAQHRKKTSFIVMLMTMFIVLTTFTNLYHSPPPTPEVTAFDNDPPRSKPIERPVVMVRYVKSPTLNVYASPGATDQLINKLSIRDRVIVLADSGNWVLVASTSPADTGYVNPQSLTDTAPPPLEISDWQWQKEDRAGTIVYEGSIENNTHETKNFVKLKLITYDIEEKFVASDDIYLPQNIPPFGRIHFHGQAKAQGNEHDAVVRVAIQ